MSVSVARLNALPLLLKTMTHSLIDSLTNLDCGLEKQLRILLGCFEGVSEAAPTRFKSSVSPARVFSGGEGGSLGASAYDSSPLFALN